MVRKRLLLLGSALALVLIAAMGDPAEATPVFARKYETSCMTCHVAPPKLNAFGRAFQLNGYQIPEGDAKLSKDHAVSLGSEGWKRVWPNGVWPGAIPGMPPVAAKGEFAFEYNKNDALKRFNQPAIALLLAGTLGKDISVYMDVDLFEEGSVGSIDRMFVQFSNVLSNWIPEYALNVRIGQFRPNAAPFLSDRGLTDTPYATSIYSPYMGNSLDEADNPDAFALESSQLGVEARGVLRSRTRYAVGLVNGLDGSKAENGYFRLAYKLGGMGFDGSGGGKHSMNAATFVDNALTVGTYGYLGSVGAQGLNVRRFGVDANITYRAANVFGSYMLGRDQVGGAGGVQNKDFYSWFTEADYAVYPWLIGIVRYETAKTDGIARVSRLVPAVTILLRANVHAAIETNVDPNDARFTNLITKLEFAF